MAKNEFIKKPNKLIEYTQEQILELKRCKEDPVYFISNYCYIQNQDHGEVKFKLRDYQIRIIENLHNNRLNILLSGRQTGKSETTAAFAYWFASFNSKKNVLVASNSQKGSTDIMDRIKFMYERTPDFLRPGVSFYNRGSIVFDNDSKIWSEATTEKTGRGRSVALVILDELAHVNHKIQQAMWSSILGTISSGSKLSLVVMSTPNGDTDLFAELWRGAVSNTNGFNPIKVDINEVPGRDEEWGKYWRLKLGDVLFEQEFKCEFLSSDPLLINSITLNNLKPKVPIFTDKGFVFWKNILPKKTYLIGSDVSEGVNRDFSTIQVFELDTLEQVAEFKTNSLKEAQLYQAIKWIISKISTYKDKETGEPPLVYWSFENNSCGAVIGNLYNQDENFPLNAELISGKAERLGFRTVNKYKLEACRNLKNLVEKTRNGLILNSNQLIFELKNYIASGASYEAKSGCTDDLVSACLIVVRIIKQLSEYEPEIFDKLYKEDSEFYEDIEEINLEPNAFLF